MRAMIGAQLVQTEGFGKLRIYSFLASETLASSALDFLLSDGVSISKARLKAILMAAVSGFIFL
jgi:hypothetical protein